MLLRRRDWLKLMPLCGGASWAQGIATRSIKPAPRGKPSGLPFHARFTDVAVAAGLNAATIYGGIDKKDAIIETTGCGAAFIDYDNDGWPDIFLLCGTRLNGDPKDATNRLYRNNRDGTFTDVTDKAGLRRTGWASAVCIGDYNNDGHDDLFITYWGQNVLYRNNGDGTFTDVTKQAGLLHPGRRWGSGCTFIEAGRNGLLDLFVASYLDFDPATVPKPGDNANCSWKGIPVNCGPRGLPPGRCYLYRNNGDGTFTDVSERSGIAKAAPGYYMTAVAADFRGAGLPDIYVACDSKPSLFFRNNGDGRFTEMGLASGVALSDDGVEQAGMGVAVGDVDLDGNLDIFKTHFAEDTSVLYRNGGKGFFDDITVHAGLGVETRYVGWGTGIFDLDNDGLPDILAVTGSVYPEVEQFLPQFPYKTPRIVFRNLGGKFEELIEEAGAGIAAMHSSRGCAFGDFDNDGDVDVLIINLNEPPTLLRNDVTRGGNWLKVKLEGVKSNRSAIGALVRARYGGKTQAQSVLSQSSFYSANDRRLHFGLGAESSADLEISWPSGLREKVVHVAANQLITVREGAGVLKAVRWSTRGAT
jgi:hypothetical protein